MIVNVLGEKYKIVEEENLKSEDANGLCEFFTKEIHLRKLVEEKDTFDNLEAYKKKVLRHEIVHAFLFESGLASNSYWADNEEIVDWIAIQFPKLAQAFKDADCEEVKK